MAITAPRFQPGGVHVGSMPTPMVRPDMSGANSLAAVGETIASLGKSAQYAQDTIEKRDRLEAQNRLTKVRGLYLDWEVTAEAEHAKATGQMVGSKAVTGLADYGKSLKSEDMTAYTKDLSPDELQEFSRLVDRRKVTLGTSASQHALAENKRYTIDVNSRTAARHLTTAATNLVAGHDAEAAVYLRDAQAAVALVADQQGASKEYQKVIWEDTRASAYKEAMSIAVSTSPEAAVRFYEKNKGAFGKFSDDVQRAAMPMYDAVSVNKHADAYNRMRDEHGNLTQDAMVKVLKGEGETGVNYIGDAFRLDEQRKLSLQTRMSAMLAVDTAQRKQLGDEVLGNIDARMMEPNGHLKAKSFAAESPKIVGRMTIEDRLALNRKLYEGPTVTDVPALHNLEAKLNTANTEQALSDLETSSHSQLLSAHDRQAFGMAVEKARSNLGSKEDKIKKDVKTLWEEKYQRKIPGYRTTEEKPLSPGEIKDINSFRSFAILVNDKLSRIEKPSQLDIERTFNAAAAEFKMPDGSGGVITLPYADVPEADRANALRGVTRARRHQLAANKIATMREEAGLGMDPGEPSTMRVLMDDIGSALEERNKRLGFAP